MDLKTMVWLLSIIYLIQVLVLAIQYRVNKQYKGVGWWLLWSLSEALGFFFLSMRELNISFLIVLQNLFLFYGTVFAYIGVGRFLEISLNRRLLWSVFIGYALLQIFFLTIYENPEARGTVVNLSAGLFGILTAWCLFKKRPAGIRFSANFTAMVFALHALFMIFSGIMKLAHQTPGNPLVSNPINYITMIDAMLISLLTVFGLIIMLNHRMNSSLVEMVRDLSEAEARDSELVRELEKSNREKDTFYSVLAHDLRSPFNSLLGLTSILKEDFSSLSPQDITSLSTSVHKSAERLYSLVESLLEWSRTQRGTISFQPENIDLGLLSEVILQPLGSMMEAKSIGIRTEIPAGLEVYSDKHMLETILRNLVMNSIKFTEKGGEIFISAHPADTGMIRVTVTDTGIGINPELAEKVFSLNPENTRKGTSGEAGTGLGLLICKEFVKKQGGDIWLQSTGGKGTTFCFTLPAVQKL